MTNPELHCLSLSCPERFSVCCYSISEAVTGNEGTGYFRCSMCKKEFIGHKCIASYDQKIVDRMANDILRNQNLNSKVFYVRDLTPKEKLLYSHESLAEWMYERYEKHAHTEGWDTQKSTKVSFKDLPEANRKTMELMARDIQYLFLTKEWDEELDGMTTQSNMNTEDWIKNIEKLKEISEKGIECPHHWKDYGSMSVICVKCGDVKFVI